MTRGPGNGLSPTQIVELQAKYLDFKRLYPHLTDTAINHRLRNELGYGIATIYKYCRMAYKRGEITEAAINRAQESILNAVGGQMEIGRHDFVENRVPATSHFLKRETKKKPETLGSFVAPPVDYVQHTQIDLDPDDTFASQRLFGVKTYIFTAWEIRVKPDYAFIDCLRQLAREYKAELYLTPCYLPDLDFLPNELRSTFKILGEDLHLNDNIFFKYVETHALSQSPLTGWRGFTDKTAILPGLIKELETLPTDKACKQLITTGSIGYMTLDSEHYRFIRESQDEAYKKRFESRWDSFRSQKRPIAIASEYVKPSAQIVHVVNDKLFLTRRVTMQPGKDYLYDLNRKYVSGRSRPLAVAPRFLMVGDTHAWFADQKAIRCTFEQIDELHPRSVILQDFTDGVSANHHEKDRAFTFHQAPPINVEIAYTRYLLRMFRQKVGKNRLIYRHSNHDDFFEKFLDAGERDWVKNYNYSTCVDLQNRRATSGKHPIQMLLDFDELGVEFSADRSPLMFDKVSVIHGHEPVTGRRAAFKELVKHYNYVAMGHGHSPKEWRNGVMAGLTAIRDMAYTEGSLNGMLHANVLGHDDNSFQLLTMIDGLWRA